MGGRAKVAVREAHSMMAVSFADAMAMMKDKKEVEAFFSKLESLKDEINEGIQKTASVKEIDRLLLQARADQIMTAEELEGARKEAKQLVTVARDKSLKEVKARDGKSLAREKDVTAGEKNLAARESRFKAGVEAWQAEMKKREAEVFEQQRVLGGQIAEAKEIKERHTVALASMKAGVAAA